MSSSFKKRIIRELKIQGRYAAGVKAIGEKRLKMFLKVWISDVKERSKDYPAYTVDKLIAGTWTNKGWMFSMDLNLKGQIKKDRLALYNESCK